MKIGFFGLRGSYTNQALNNIVNLLKLDLEDETEYKSFEFLSMLFESVENKDIELAVIPIENSSGGGVSQVLDMFPKYNFSILCEYFLPINHVLLAKKYVNLNEIKEVYSHPQSLVQTSIFFKKHNLKAVPYADNASCAKYISENNFLDKASIGSEILADIYDLKIIKRDIQNFQKNVTRFLLIGVKDKKNIKKVKGGEYKTSLMFVTRDLPGVLYKCLGGFATNNISLTKIESRPLGDKNFDYFFFLEFNGNLKDKGVELALEELDFYTKEVKIFGSYQEIK